MRSAGRHPLPPPLRRCHCCCSLPPPLLWCSCRCCARLRPVNSQGVQSRICPHLVIRVSPYHHQERFPGLAISILFSLSLDLVAGNRIPDRSRAQDDLRLRTRSLCRRPAPVQWGLARCCCASSATSSICGARTPADTLELPDSGRQLPPITGYTPRATERQF